MKTLVATALLLALTTTGAYGGILWRDPSNHGGAELQVAFPKFDGDGPSGQVVSLTGSRRWNEDLVVHGDLPFSTVSIDGARGNVLGNPYLGVELGKVHMDWTLEGGLRLPLVPGDPSLHELAALSSAGITDFIPRPDAFVVDAVPIEVTFHYRGGSLAHTRTTAQLGVEVWAPIGDRQDSEKFFVYGGDVWLNAQPWRFDLGARGRLRFHETGDENEIELALGMQGEMERARPGLELRIPVDDLTNLLDFVLTVYVGIR